jgi:hypothetical protein
MHESEKAGASGSLSKTYMPKQNLSAQQGATHLEGKFTSPRQQSTSQTTYQILDFRATDTIKRNHQ